MFIKPRLPRPLCSWIVKAQTNPTTNFVVVRGAIPTELSNGRIYVNPNGNRAHHLCACGCGSRVLTPLNSHEWRLAGSDLSPSLTPSVGNWNLECQSHYWIKHGRVAWAPRWTPAQIATGRASEQRPYLEGTWLEKLRGWISRTADAIFGTRK